MLFIIIQFIYSDKSCDRIHDTVIYLMEGGIVPPQTFILITQFHLSICLHSNNDVYVSICSYLMCGCVCVGVYGAYFLISLTKMNLKYLSLY